MNTHYFLETKRGRYFVKIDEIKSEIEVKQSIGRGTRKAEGKDSFILYDFNVVVNGNFNCSTARHAKQRKSIYYSIYPEVKEITLI